MAEYNENKKDVAVIPVVDWETELCNRVLDEWTKGKTYVSDLDDLYEDLYKMLRGERPEKNYDWQSNVVINKVFQVIWTAIPYLTQKIFGANPIMGVDSPDKDGAFQRESVLQFWHTFQPASNAKHTPFFIVMTMWMLRALLNGVGIVKKSWHQKLKTETTEEQITVPMTMDDAGNEIDVEPHTVKRKVTIPIEDWPYNRVVNNKDIVVDWMLQPGQSVRQGRFIIERNLVDLDSLYSSKINYINLDKLSPFNKASGSETQQDHAGLKDKDGQGDIPESDFYSEAEAYERQGTFPVYKEDGEWLPCFDKEKMVEKGVTYRQMICTIAKFAGDEKGNVLIRFEPNPAGEMTYIDMHIYLDPERWQSTGMVEPAKDLFIAMNDNINAMFDEIWQNLMPPVVVDKFALWDWDTMQYAPQQRWLVGGPPENAIKFKEPSNITRDAWQKHALLDGEQQLTTAVTPPMQGGGKEKAATTNVLNAQMSAGKLDFIVRMIEQTALIPSAQMDIRLAKKFAHPLTFEMILGQKFLIGDWEDIYKYVPAAASVKLEHQKESETQSDLQLMQVVGQVNNPNTAKVVNLFLKNIMRNRGWPEEAKLLDEDYFEPNGDAGNMQMMKKMMGGGPKPGATSNQSGQQMSGTERGVRARTYQPRGMTNAR